MEFVKFSFRTGFYKLFGHSASGHRWRVWAKWCNVSFSFFQNGHVFYWARKSFLLNSISCLCGHMRSLLNYWLGKTGKVGTHALCICQGRVFPPQVVANCPPPPCLSVSIAHLIERWSLAGSTAEGHSGSLSWEERWQLLPKSSDELFFICSNLRCSCSNSGKVTPPSYAQSGGKPGSFRATEKSSLTNVARRH